MNSQVAGFVLWLRYDTIANMNAARKGFIATLLFLATVCLPAVDELRPRVAVLPVRNFTDEVAYDTLTRTMSETIALALRLLGDYEVVQYTAAQTHDVVPSYERDEIAGFARDEAVEDVVYGMADRDEQGRLRFTLRLYDAPAGVIKATRSETAFSVFDVFDVADEIVASMLAEFSDIRIAYGAVELIREGRAGQYKVFLNDTRIHNPEQTLQKILNGEYTLSIVQNRLAGETVVFSQDVTVLEDEVTEVRFSIPPASEAEYERLEELSQPLETAAANPEEIERLLSEVGEYQRLTIAADYDPALAERRDSVVESASGSAVDELIAIEETGDEIFYGPRPDFAAARETYERGARLLNDVYEHETVTDDLTEPVWVSILPNGSSLVLDAGGDITLHRIAADGRPANQIRLETNSSRLSEALFATPDDRLYYLDQEGSSVLVLDHRLQVQRTLAVPGEPAPATGLAVDRTGMAYLVGRSDVRVFDAAGERSTSIEEEIARSLREAGIADSAEPETPAPQVMLDPSGYLTVFAGTEGRLIRMNGFGELVSTVSIPEAQPNSRCHIDSMGTIYVTQPADHTFSVHARDGEVVNVYGEYGFEQGNFAQPLGIAVGDDGTILIADSFNGRVQKLTATSPPMLVPRVSQIGIRFARRVARAEAAERQVVSARAGLSPLAVLVNTVLSSGSIVGAAYLGTLSDAAMERADTAYDQYLAATSVDEASEYRGIVTEQWLVSQAEMMGAIGSAALGGALFTSALLTGVDWLTAEARAIENIQAFGMDHEYALDRDRYRSLAASRSVAYWTGVAPPLLFGPVAIASFVLESTFQEEEWYRPASLAVGATAVAIPPIFGHAYSGRFHVGLATAGLVADGLMAAAFYVQETRGADFVASDFPWLDPSHQTYDIVNTVWRGFQDYATLYLSTTAVGVRLTAGLYDHDRSWIEAQNTNLFRAVQPVREIHDDPTTRSVSVVPILDLRRGVGVAVRTSY